MADQASPDTKPEPREPEKALLWEFVDQPSIAVLTVIWLVAGMLWYAWANLGSRETIEFETAAELSYEFQVDINEADWPELAQLPGLGETLAKRIVISREQDGPYRRLEDLTRVKGIGPRTLERIRPYLAPLPSISTTAETTSEGIATRYP
ncbi:hypothetical protein JCM19992_18690 [Thermostilla marina]